MTPSAIRRGYLLKALHMSYPRPLGDRTILLFMIELGYSVADFEKDIEYLREKGYIEMEEKKLEIYPSTIRLVKLTPKGIDLVEGTIKDNGVVFNGQAK